ncbi:MULTISPECIES: hypothetical protein [Lactobacillales]|nr:MULTISPECIES: hypothetical protein [Lactobacillales]MBU7545388.1 hypothetical protein [Weissella cibaria]MCV3318696.1 hypothetical protein [Weissella cibaria]COJ58829.1 Uncharacterised protein [Streptococcus pneumoniae]
MANRFEENGVLSSDYTIVKDMENNTENLSWERKVRTSVSIKKSNIEKLDDLVVKLHAKSRSDILDVLIEKGYDDLL